MAGDGRFLLARAALHIDPEHGEAQAPIAEQEGRRLRRRREHGGVAAPQIVDDDVGERRAFERELEVRGRIAAATSVSAVGLWQPAGRSQPYAAAATTILKPCVTAPRRALVTSPAQPSILRPCFAWNISTASIVFGPCV